MKKKKMMQKDHPFTYEIIKRAMSDFSYSIDENINILLSVTEGVLYIKDSLNKVDNKDILNTLSHALNMEHQDIIISDEIMHATSEAMKKVLHNESLVDMEDIMKLHSELKLGSGDLLWKIIYETRQGYEKRDVELESVSMSSSISERSFESYSYYSSSSAQLITDTQKTISFFQEKDKQEEEHIAADLPILKKI